MNATGFQIKQAGSQSTLTIGETIIPLEGYEISKSSSSGVDIRLHIHLDDDIDSDGRLRPENAYVWNVTPI